MLRISENITGGFIYAWGGPWGIPGDDVKVSGSFPDKITKLDHFGGGVNSNASSTESAHSASRC